VDSGGFGFARSAAIRYGGGASSVTLESDGIMTFSLSDAALQDGCRAGGQVGPWPRGPRRSGSRGTPAA
jgi:hypothetical protein